MRAGREPLAADRDGAPQDHLDEVLDGAKTKAVLEELNGRHLDTDESDLMAIEPIQFHRQTHGKLEVREQTVRTVTVAVP